MLEGYEEHHVVDLLMGELESLASTTRRWGAKAKVMKENVEHHMEEEEGEMFKQARQVFDRDELEDLGDRMAERRISAAARSDPGARPGPSGTGTMARIWRDYGLSITLVGLFLGPGPLQTWTGWVEFVARAAAHGQAATAFGDGGYVWSWAQSTFENWQSEFLQVFVFIVLTTFLVHRQSHESPDTDYETEAALRRIEAKVDALERRAAR